MESLKNGKCVLEKSLNFLFKKEDEPWKSERSVRGGDSEKRFAACSIRTRLRFQFAANLFARPKKVASYADLTMLYIGVQIVGISQRDVSRKNSEGATAL